jgi:hypothetical protein
MDQTHLRPAQVGASTAAAVGGAFLASGLGVYGTIIGVGVISLMSTVGSEMLLRSLDRTKQAARSAAPRLRATAPALADATGPINTAPGQNITAHTRPDLPVIADKPEPEPAATPRWPLVVGGSLASFGLALAAITGIEAFTGRSAAGDDGTTIINVIRGDGQSSGEAPSAPTTPTGEPSPAPSEDATSPGDGTTPRPEPSTPPAGATPPADGETTSPDGETPPPDTEETPPPGEGETPPPTGVPTPAPTP